jgi:hypothetical protein
MTASAKCLGPLRRHRGIYLLLVCVVIACGLGSRSEIVALSPFFAKYVGNALWALMIFIGLGSVFPSRSTAWVAGWAAAVSASVEFSQLYHAPWIDAVRRTWIGRMALGDTFAWGDMAAYAVGIVFGGLGEWGYRFYDSRT